MDLTSNGSATGKDAGGNHELAHGAQAEQTAPNLIQQIMDHSKATWKHVEQRKANAAEYLEAGVEIVAAGVAARYGLSRLGFSADNALLKTAEDAGKTLKAEQGLARTEDILSPQTISTAGMRDEAIDRLSPVLTRRTLRYTIDSHFPRDQF